MSSNLVFPTSPTSIKVNNKDLLFCFDFEFNDFQEKKPISLGISSLDRKHKFYREFKYDDNYASVNDWVKKNVIAHLDNKPFSKEEILKEFNDFLSQFSGHNIYLLSDHPVDVEIIQKLNAKTDICVNIMPMQLYVLAYAIHCYFKEDLDDRATSAKIMNLYNETLEPLVDYEDYFVENNIIQHQALNDSVVMATLLEQGFNKRTIHNDIQP